MTGDTGTVHSEDSQGKQGTVSLPEFWSRKSLEAALRLGECPCDAEPTLHGYRTPVSVADRQHEPDMAMG